MKELKYLNIVSLLPAEAPLGHPHLLDLDSIDTEEFQPDLRIADMVVTVCYNHKPSTLDHFLDHSRDFMLRRCQVPYQGLDDFCIVRKEDFITVSEHPAILS